MKIKLYILILVMAVVCTVMPQNTFAITDNIRDVYIYYGDEESMGTSRGDWHINSQSEGTYIEKKNIDGECAFHFYGGESGDSIGAVIFLSQIKRNDCDKFVVQFKLRYDNISSVVNSTADAGPNPNWHFFNYFSLDSGGGMAVNGRNITTIQSGKFYEFAFLTDNAAKSCKVYVNGTFSGSFTFDEDYNWLAEYAMSVKGRDGGAHMYIADLAIYEADTVASYEEIENAYAKKKATVSDCPMEEELQNFAGDYTLFAADAPYIYADGSRKRAEVLFKDNANKLMAPVKYTAEIFGGVYSESENVVNVSYKGNTIEFSEDKFEGKLVRKDGILYAEAEKYLSLFGSVYMGEEHLFAAVGTDNFGTHFSDRVDEREMYHYLMYRKPSPEEILADFQSTSQNVHPRIYYTEEKIDKIKKQIETDEDMKIWYDRQLDDAQKVYNLPIIEVIKTDSNLNTSYSGDVSSFSKLAFAYMVTKDKMWGEDLWRAINGFIDLNEDLNHRRAFLNGSEGARQIALAYDWAYDYFTDEQKDKIENYLYVTTFEPWMRAHQGLAGYSSASYAYKSMSNINCVLSSQIGVSALALFDENPEFYSRLLCAIYRQMEYFLPCYAPDGGFYEGASYWEYATTNLVNLFDATESTLGTLYGMYDVFNVKNTGEFPLYMNGGKLQFNFGDGYRLSLVGNLSTSYYFAMKNGDKEFARAIVDMMREAGYPVGNRWYDADFVAQESKTFSLDRYFRDVEAGSMRENWTSNTTYLAYHGGENGIGHGDLDIGTFVFDAFGKRWAEELGSDDYNYDQYFGTKRYLYYKKRGEGQNVLLINPYGKYEDQKKDAFSSLTESASGEMGAYAVLDTSEAYGDDVESAKRGYMLTDNRRQAVIRDEVLLSGGGNELYWFMHTMVEDIELSDDGKTAVLTQGRHKCILQLSSNKAAVFEIMEPVHMAQSTRPEDKYYTDLTGVYKKLGVHITGAEGEVYINVCMRVTDVTSEKEMPAVINSPLSQWDSIYDKDYENPPLSQKVFFTDDENTILYPVNGSEIITEKAFISVSGAAVKKADIYVDDKLVGTFSKPPFGKSVALSDGVHIIKAEYTDIYGQEHTLYSNITVEAKYSVVNERQFHFEDFDGYEEKAASFMVYKDSLFLIGYGTDAKHAYMHIADTDYGYGKSVFSETITGDMMGFGITDWGDTWCDALYVEYDFLGSEFANRRSELYSPQCHGARLCPYIIENGKVMRDDRVLYTLENNKWYKIAMLFDSVDREVSLYINGECVTKNDYYEPLYGVMRPGNIVIGSYIPNSVMLIDNYMAVHLGRMPRVSLTGESGEDGIINEGETRIKITSENFLLKSSLNLSNISVKENTNEKSFSIDYGIATMVSGKEYVKDITLVLSEAAKKNCEYTITLKKGINTKIENTSSERFITYSGDKSFKLYSEGVTGFSEIKTEHSDGNVKYSFTAINNEEGTSEAVIVAAFYWDEGICDVKIIRENIPTGTNIVSGTVLYPAEAKTHKIFFTDMID